MVPGGRVGVWVDGFGGGLKGFWRFAIFFGVKVRKEGWDLQ